MQSFEVIEVRGLRVLTTKQIAEAYKADVKTIQYNFRYNKDRYKEGKHYIEILGEELRRLKTRSEFHSSLKYAKSLYLWTEKGALLHAKSLNTDKAWEVYDYLVDFYFRAKEEEPAPVETKPAPAPVEEPKGKPPIPVMDNPLKILKVLLRVADDKGIKVNSFPFRTADSVLKNDHIGIRTEMSIEKVTYELAWTLSHAFIHYDDGNMMQSPLAKEYNNQATRSADMIIKILNVKMSQM